jgi:tetratricopeptide (TPR) repeat protein
MKKVAFLLVFVLCLINTNLILAQSAKISEKQFSLITYPFSDPNPNPVFGKIYPYSRFEGYSKEGLPHTWKMVEMENDFIKLWVAPEVGGKIWGAIEKSTGRAFIYFNHVAKFRDVAIRGPWTSGGIEMNFGVFGHAPTCSNPVDYLIRKNEDGSVSCFVGAIDLPSRTRWSVEINLPKDKAYFTTRSVWDNPTGLEQSYYHWMNMGIKSSGNLEYIFPGNHHLGHDGKPSPWPVDEKGNDISFYEKNNFGSYKSHHVFGELAPFYGAYWHDDDFGFAHYAAYDAKPGKKIWIWGLSDEGMIWEKLLTDHDGQYTEIQSGRLFNQAANESSDTPFKNRGFAAGSTDEWTEYWFPVKHTEGLRSASPSGSVNLQQNGKLVRWWFCPNEKIDGNLEVRNGSKQLFSKKIKSEPMQTVTDSFRYDGSYIDLTVWLDNQQLFGANQEKYQLKRPVDPAAGFNWETAYGHSLKGKEMERQRLYKSAMEEYRKALAIEPCFLPALIGMANMAYRKTDFSTSMDYALRALSVDTYDPEANMIYGLAGLAKGDTTSAMDGFSIAASAISHRSVAYKDLASIYLVQNEYAKALEYVEKSLAYNQTGSESLQLKILCLRKLGRKQEAAAELNKLEIKDPLNHFIRFEKFIDDPSADNETEVKSHISFEFPQEIYLECALWYFRNGQVRDALRILDLAPQDHPVVLLWKGYLNHLSGNEQPAVVALTHALELNPKLVFPFRTETLKPLAWAKTMSDDWKISYYAGLICFNAGADDKGRSLWADCGNRPDFPPFYIARSQQDSLKDQKQSDIGRALALAGNDWQTGLFASKYFMDQGSLQKAEGLAREFYVKNPQNYVLGLHFAKVLELSKNYTACVSLLQKIEVLPNEGATEGRTIWRNANIGKALDLMKNKKYRKALESIDMARQWPMNLGIGKPYRVDDMLENFIAFQCFLKLNDRLSAEKLQNKMISETGRQDLSPDENDFLIAWLLNKSGNKLEGDRIMNGLIAKYPSSKSIQWCIAIYAGDLEKAKTIANGFSSNDQISSFISMLYDLIL